MNKTIENLIHKSNSVLISSIDDEGYPNTKAMLPPRKIENNTFYFTTNTSSMRVSQYRENPKASIYFFDPKTFRGVMFKGNMSVLENKEDKEMIWQEGDTLYYSKDVNDPDYGVLKFTATEGRYYENFHSESFTINK